MAAGFMAGAVVAKLLLDKTQWANSVKSVKGDEAKLTGMSTRTAGNFRKIGTAMTGAGIAVVAGLGSMIKKYVEAGDWVDKMAKRTGFAATTLSELKYAADISGASITDVEKAAKKMAKTIVDADEGMATYVRSFDRLGISVTELQKLSPEDQFLQIGNAIAELESPTLRAATAQEIFGRAGTTLLPLFAEGEAGLTALREEAHKLGIVFDEEAAAKAAKLKDAQTALSESFKGLGFALAEKLVPPLTDLVTKITDVMKDVNAWAKANPTLSGTLVKVAAGAGGLLAVLGPIVILVPKMVLGIKGIGLAMKAALGPIGLVVAGLAAAGAVMNAWINARKEALDIEMDAMVADKTLGTTLELRRKLIEDNIMTQEEWTELVNKHGRDYKAVMNAINTDPALANVKVALDDVTKAEEVTGDATDDLGTDYEDLMGQIGGTNEVAKTWTDYLKDNAIQTLEDKRAKVEELEGFLSDLATAYEDGKLSLEDYSAAQEIAHDELVELGAASKTYYDHLEEMGIPTTEAQAEALDTTKIRLEALNTAYKNGDIDQANYKSGIELLEKALEDISADFIIVDGQVQQLGRDFDAFVPAAHDYGSALADMMGPAIEGTQELESQTFSTTQKVPSMWATASQLMKDKWTTELGDMLSGAKSLGDGLDAIWGTVKDQFFDMAAQMLSKFTFDLIGGILSKGPDLIGGIGSMFSSAAGAGTTAMAGAETSVLGNFATMAGPLGIGLMAVQLIGMENISKTVQGVWNAVSDVVIGNIKAIGEFGTKILGGLGDLLGGLLSGLGGLAGGLGGLGGKKSVLSTTDQWNLDAIQKNTKELRDYTFINIGSGSGWLAQIKDVNYVIVGKLETLFKKHDKLRDIESKSRGYLNTIKNKSNQAVGLLEAIKSNTKDTVKALKSIPGAQSGFASTRNELVELHGTPQAPEYVVPHNDMSRLMNSSPATPEVNYNVRVANNVTLAGTIITDKDHTRQTLIPEIIAALRANVGKTALKEQLGIA